MMKTLVKTEEQLLQLEERRLKRGTDPNYKPQYVWKNVVFMTFLHLGALYGLYLILTTARLITFVWTMFYATLSGLGITAGAHRLWTHRAYKAKLPLRIFLGFCNTVAVQNSIYEWTRDHRVHHKFSETDADPHNACRGFFFAHVGWLLQKKHPYVKKFGKSVEIDDLKQDSVVMFQKEHYLPLVAVFSLILPALVPWYFLSETFMTSWFVATMFRYVLSLHFTWLVNSAAHLWGNKPYDKFINPSENRLVAFLAFGEGWHNYHHTFPWDYKTSELGGYSLNLTTAFIDACAYFGLAYDLKTCPDSLVKSKVLNAGDGSHPVYHRGETCSS